MSEDPAEGIPCLWMRGGTSKGGYFLKDDLPADPAARLQDGALEGSNVSAVETMVAMISAARHFELQMRSMQTAEKDEQQAQQLLSLN